MIRLPVAKSTTCQNRLGSNTPHTQASFRSVLDSWQMGRTTRSVIAARLNRRLKPGKA